MSNTPTPVYLTHDIDWIDPWHPYSLVKSVTPGKKWLPLRQLKNRRVFLNQIEKVLALESDLGVQSIFLTGASLHSYSRYGIRYTPGNPLFTELLNVLSECEIGLQSTPDGLQTQIEQHQTLTGRPLRFHRSHYMQAGNERTLEVLAQNGILVDFTLGNLRRPAYQRERITQGVMQIPVLLSDNAFFFNPPEETLRGFESNLNLAVVNNTPVSILFHPENTLIMPELWEYYKQVIHICRSQNTLFIKP